MEKQSLSKDKIKFLLLEGVHEKAVSHLQRNGYTNIQYLKTALSNDELIKAIADAHFVGIRSRTQLTEEVLQAAQKLIGIGCFCIGTNQVNLKARQHETISTVSIMEFYLFIRGETRLTLWACPAFRHRGRKKSQARGLQHF